MLLIFCGCLIILNNKKGKYLMKILTSIAILMTAASLTSCAARNSSPDMQIHPKMKPAMMKPVMKKAPTMMKKAPVQTNAACHTHAANSMTKSSKHCHKSASASHSHKYSGK
jgi:hypothetical protein